MIKYVAFLRGINVGGKNIIKMEVLKDLFESLHFKNVITFIQSGNVIFESEIKDRKILIKQIEAGLKKELGNNVAVIIRTKEEMNNIIKLDPI